jgi:hypothetical protein
MIGLASAWLRHLLAAEMRIEDLMRLWGESFHSLLRSSDILIVFLARRHLLCCT